jgi:hypothetical protein
MKMLRWPFRWAMTLSLLTAGAGRAAVVDPHLGGAQDWKVNLHMGAFRQAKLEVFSPHLLHSNRAHLGLNSTASTQHARSTHGRVYPVDPITIEGLLARRALDPARFDQFHHKLGRILAKDARLRAGMGLDCSSFNGLLAPTAYHRYLKFRRSLNPRRFDHYHPVLGPLLAEDNRLRLVANCPEFPPQFLIPPIAPPPGSQNEHGHGNPPPPPPPVTPVPEPAGLTLFLIGAASAGLQRLVGRRRGRMALPGEV